MKEQNNLKDDQRYDHLFKGKDVKLHSDYGRRFECRKKLPAIQIC